MLRSSPGLLFLLVALTGPACSGENASPAAAGSGGAPAGGGAVGGIAGLTAAGSTSVVAGGAAGSSSSAAGAGMATAGAGGSPIGPAAPGAILDPTCWDGMVYAAESVPDTRANIDDLIAQFSVPNRTAWSIQVLERRYPTGAELLRGATMDDPDGEGNCLGIAYQPSDDWQDIIAGFRTSVHECGHMMDLQFDRYMIRTDLEYRCANDIWEGSPMRSVLLDDEFDALGPTGGTLDFQKEVYLQPTGDPGSGGDERFYLLFTEFSQYINTLATSYAVYDYAPDDIVAGDASRDFAWFIERYLRILRAQYPAEYDKLGKNECWRRLVLADWGKLNRYWDESKGLEKLVSDEAAKVDELIRDPRLLAEIENLRVLDGCRQ